MRASLKSPRKPERRAAHKGAFFVGNEKLYPEVGHNR